MKTKLKLTGSASEVFTALSNLRDRTATGWMDSISTESTHKSEFIWRGDRQLGQPLVVHVRSSRNEPPTVTLETGLETNIEWGYEGAGPQALANQILTTLYGEDTALEFGYDFKVDVISQLPDSWILTAEDVAIWIEKRRAV